MTGPYFTLLSLFVARRAPARLAITLLACFLGGTVVPPAAAQRRQRPVPEKARRAATTADQAAVEGPGPNILKNADFARHSEHWSLDRNGPRASANIEWLEPSQAPPGVNGRVARFQIADPGEQNWQIQFHQAGVELKEGLPYCLSFWARGDRDRPLTVRMYSPRPTPHPVGLIANRLVLKREWQRIRIDFIASDTVEGQNRLSFLLGDAPGAVDLAGISLCRAVTGPWRGQNVLSNSDFAEEGSSWRLECSNRKAAATVTWLPALEQGPAGVSGKVARFNLTALGDRSWQIQFFQPGIDLNDSQPYTLWFWARADRERLLAINATVDEPDWHVVGLVHQVTLGPEWRKYGITFLPEKTVRSHTRLVFILGDALGTVDLAGLALRHQPNAIMAAGSHPLVGTWESHGKQRARRMTLVLNADGTGSLQEGSAAAALRTPPRAPAANPFRWYLKNGEKSLVLGTKTYEWALRDTGPEVRLTLKNGRGMDFVLYRR